MTEKKLENLELENQLLRNHIRDIQSRFEEKIAELSMVSEIGQATVNVRSFKKTCRYILDNIINNTLAQNCSIMLFDHEKSQLFLLCATNPQKKSYVLELEKVFSKEGLRYLFNLGEGVAGKALLEKRIILIQNAKESEYFSIADNNQVKIGSLISIPLIIEGERFGVINLSHLENNVFEENDIHLFNVISNVVAIIIYNTLQHGKLRDSEQKYRTVLDNIEDGYYEVDIAGNLTFFNDSLCKIYGYSRNELMGMGYKQYTDKENGKEVFQLFNLVYRTGEPAKAFDWVFIKKNKTTINVETSVSLMKDDDGNPIGFRGIVRDITERKQVEEALRESEEKLARSKKMEALGLLAGGVAHDLNNVLSGVVSYPELILLDMSEDNPLRKPIETIQETGHRAAAIIQDLLTVARGVAIAKEPLSLNAIVEGYLRSPEFEKLEQFHPTVTIKTNLDTDLLNISGSDAHLRKVVMNLVSNASEAIEGGGDVIISTMNRYVDKSIRGYDNVNVGEYAVLSVSDDGPGILPDALERIFEPFYTKKVMGRSGTGLGLAVVWNVVQDLKGYIDVISDENGTTFELYFPITRDEVSVEDLSIPIQDYKGDGETVLVVDDVESQREIACEMLNTLGYKAKAISSGEEAVEYLTEHTVDLILLDMIMGPGINGRETYEQIIKIHPDQKTVIASGFAETEDVMEAQRLGAGQYIKKPLTLEKMGIAVRDELKK